MRCPFWGQAYFQLLLLLVLGSVDFKNQSHRMRVWYIYLRLHLDDSYGSM